MTSLFLRFSSKISASALTAFLMMGATAQAQVGMSQIQVGQLPVTMVYPTQATARPVQRGPFELMVAPDASPDTKQHRLIVLSHGTAGSPHADFNLAATLARAGFVVAQPLHAGDNFQDASKAGPAAFQTRPTEVSQVIDALARHPRWASLLVLDKVAVHGMSAGGITGLALAGAQWRTLNLVQHCNKVQELDEGFCFQGAASGEARKERAANFERAKGVPEVFLPNDIKTQHGGLNAKDGEAEVRPDKRIASVTLSVPVAAIFSAQSLARIQIPVGLVTAKGDDVLVPRFHSEHVLEHCRTCRRLADLPAGHFDLLSPWPEAIAREVARGQVRGGLPMPGFDAKLRDAAFMQIVQFHLKNLSVFAQAKL